jgi:hypothetical protein
MINWVMSFKDFNGGCGRCGELTHLDFVAGSVLYFNKDALRYMIIPTTPIYCTHCLAQMTVLNVQISTIDVTKEFAEMVKGESGEVSKM